MEQWIPLTQFAIEEGVSISTLRRKIKANKIEWRLDNGRYLIKSEDSGSRLNSQAHAINRNRESVFNISSDDTAEANSPLRAIQLAKSQMVPLENHDSSELSSKMADFELRWKAMEARVNGLAKKVEFLVEQNSELNMLVKVFEEKLNATI